MSFKPNTQDELKKLNLEDGKEYKVKYQNRDYFNGEDTIEISMAKAMIQDDEFVFVVTDPMGMDKFVKDVELV